MARKSKTKKTPKAKRNLASSVEAPIEIEDSSENDNTPTPRPILIGLEPSSEEKPIASPTPVQHSRVDDAQIKRALPATPKPMKAAKFPRLTGTTPQSLTREKTSVDMRSPSPSTTEASSSGSRPVTPSPAPKLGYPHTTLNRELAASKYRDHLAVYHKQ
ncbi:hypothetical protein DL93DRAFT_290796 [Clavulina sp. PMI_390]|nr:hypothetical protein DL93DRAFT_290796 [Clavulina sp. PMI_390]